MTQKSWKPEFAKRLEALWLSIPGVSPKEAERKVEEAAARVYKKAFDTRQCTLRYCLCGWMYPDDASFAAMANQCPKCGRWGHFFVHGTQEELREHCRKQGWVVPTWLTE